MKLIAFTFACAALTIAFVADALAQGNIVKLTVTKTQKSIRERVKTGGEEYTNYNVGPGGGSTTYRQPETSSIKIKGTIVQYHIEVATQSPAPPPDLTVKWTVLLKDASTRQGSESGKIAMGKKWTFDTDTITGDVVGYLVEAYAGDKLMAVSYDPPDIKKKIEQGIEKELKKEKPDPKIKKP